jgi:hypothetical protein
VDLYFQHHHAYPGQRGDGSAEGSPGTEAAFLSQLCQITAADGRTARERDGRFQFGPYLRHGVPPCPVTADGKSCRVLLIHGNAPPAFVHDRPDIAWVFNCETGMIAANSDRTDASGRRYDRY